jgi:2-polyprenyl-6-methoxyphenol hydroxylase-like FAD-dependent oxidoreductase
MKSETDVVIVGAGPTGLALACQLIRYGVDFVQIEKNEGPTPFSKALGVHARTMEIYDQMGLAQTAIERGAVAKMVRLMEGGEVRGELDFSNVGAGMSPFPYLLVLEQSENERLMYEYLLAHGRDVDWQTSLDQLTQNAPGATVHYTGPKGEGEIRAKYVVGCDGAKSGVRGDLGLSFGGSTFERIFYVADVRLDSELDHDALHVCLAEDAFILFFPMRGERRYRIVGVFPEDAQEKEGDALYAEIERHVIEQSELRLDITEVNWFSSYKVHARRVDRFANGRGFVAGDAAHIHSPAGAQGMNAGIQDAYNLAWKLALVLKGQAAPALLDTYNEERLENAQRLLDTTDRLFQFGTGSDWFIKLLRTAIFPPLAGFALSFDAVRKMVFPLISQIGITYRDCSLSDHRADRGLAIKAGDRMPYFLVEGENIYDRLREPKFHLVTFSDGRTHNADLRRIGQEYATVLDQQIIPLYPQVAEVFGSESTFHVLLRPDNYIAVLATENAAQIVEEFLTRLAARA